MASLPQAAFAACKLREYYNNNNLLLSSHCNTADDIYNDKIPNDKTQIMNARYGLAKYNEKFMNSVWNVYNRFSPYNVNSNELVDQENLKFNSQLSAASE